MLIMIDIIIDDDNDDEDDDDDDDDDDECFIRKRSITSVFPLLGNFCLDNCIRTLIAVNVFNNQGRFIPLARRFNAIFFDYGNNNLVSHLCISICQSVHVSHNAENMVVKLFIQLMLMFTFFIENNVRIKTIFLIANRYCSTQNESE